MSIIKIEFETEHFENILTQIMNNNYDLWEDVVDKKRCEKHHRVEQLTNKLAILLLSKSIIKDDEKNEDKDEW